MGDLNRQKMHDRIKIGRSKEDFILEMLNLVGMDVNDEPIVRYERASDEEDRKQKIDAWAVSKSGFYYSMQIKFRDAEVGKDLGLALVRPFTDHATYAEQFPAVPLDRDMQTDVDFYVVMTAEPKIIVADGAKVKEVCMGLLADLAADRAGFGEGRCFPRGQMNGAQLRLVTDKGRGYTAGQQKIIAYISPRFLEKSAGAFTVAGV